MQLVQNVHRFASCAIGQVMLHSSAKNMVKSTVSLLFVSLCTNDLEPRWAGPWSNSKPRHALSTNNGFHDQLPECALLCLTHCSVAFSLSHAVLYFRLNAYQESKTHENCTFSVLFKPLRTLDLKMRDVAKWSNSAIIHALSTKTKSSWHKSLNCPERAQLTRVL